MATQGVVRDDSGGRGRETQGENVKEAVKLLNRLSANKMCNKGSNYGKNIILGCYGNTNLWD